MYLCIASAFSNIQLFHLRNAHRDTKHIYIGGFVEMLVVCPTGRNPALHEIVPPHSQKSDSQMYLGCFSHAIKYMV